MATKITAIYSAIITNLGTIFASKTRIPNAYDVENNPRNLISNGYGLKVSSAAPQQQAISKITQSRTFTVTLTKEVYRLDTNTTAIDTTSKEILEDAKTLIDNIEGTAEIGAGASIHKLEYTGCSGIILIGVSKSHFVSMDIDFDVLYSEVRL